MNEKQQPINDMLSSAIANLRSLVDVNTIIGDPITTPDGTTILPVSKVSFGYVSGGADLPVQIQDRFAGGTGGGITLQPLGFLVIQGENVRLLQLQTADTTSDRLVNASANAVDRIIDLLPKKNKPVSSIDATKTDETPLKGE